MALLDLQNMKTEPSTPHKAPAGSRASKGCGNGGNASLLSLLLCF